MSQNLVRTESTPVAPIDADRMVSASTADRLARAVPTETRRAYSGDWNRFNTWATDAGRTSMPATAETLAEYATHLADLGRAPGTIERAVADRGSGPILRTRNGTRMDRHCATRRPGRRGHHHPQGSSPQRCRPSRHAPPRGRASGHP